MVMDASYVWELGTVGCWRITVFLAQRSWTNMYLQPLGFLTNKIRVTQGLTIYGVAQTRTWLTRLSSSSSSTKKCWILEAYGLLLRLYALKNFFTYRIFINSGRRFWGIYLYLDGRCAVNFSNIRWRFCSIWRLTVDSIETKWSVFWEIALVLSEMEEIEVAWLAILMSIVKFYN